MWVHLFVWNFCLSFTFFFSAYDDIAFSNCMGFKVSILSQMYLYSSSFGRTKDSIKNDLA
jgi:hypothetical protein